MSQCVELAPLWHGAEFFMASSPRELRQLLIEMRFANVDTVWLHLEAHDSLYITAFPAGKPVTPIQMDVIQTRSFYKTWWRIYELVMNRKDSRWAGILESEAGALMRDHQAENALRLQREAVEIAPHSAESRSNLALILAEVGRRDEARAEARAALEMDSTLTEPVRLLELLSAPAATAP
jgi:tetratricopeptide (TPR) repeat protein